MNRFRLFFFINYMGNGVLIPYLPLYLIEKNLDPAQLGIALGLLPFVKIAAQPIWGLIGDARQANRQILSLSLFLLAGTALIFPIANGFWGVIGAVILFGIMEAPYIPFGVALALDYLERRGHTDAFGPLRTWGSVGYIVAAMIVGATLLERHLSAIPLVFCAVMATAAVLSLMLPESSGVERTFRITEGIRALAGRSDLGILLLGMILGGMALGIFSQYLPIYLQELGAAGWLIGMLLSLQAALEIPLMARGPQILRRIGAPTALVLGVAALPLRAGLYAMLHTPLLLLPVQLLHGLTMSGLMVAGAIHVSRLVPARLRATGQSLFSTAYGGLGWSLGLLTAGPIFAGWGMSGVWIYSLVCGLGCTGVTAAALIWGSRRSTGRGV